LKYELYHESKDDSIIEFALDVLERTIGPLRGVRNTITRKSIGYGILGGSAKNRALIEMRS